MRRNRLIIIRGCPGSGKSTYANKAFPGVFHLENDMFHMKDGVYAFDVKKQENAVSWCMDMAKTALDAGMDVCVSNTFTQRRCVEAYRRLADPEKTDFVVYRMRGEFENRHSVPAKVLKNMRDHFQDYEGEISIRPSPEK
jgi:predicted kinase